MAKVVAAIWSFFDRLLGLSVRLKRVTPALAQQMLQTMRYPQQRALRAVNVAFFGTLMDEGSFRPGSVIMLAKYKKKTFIIDGYHRLTAMAERGISQRLVIITYTCRSMEQVNALYISIDSGIGTRSRVDMYVAYYGQKVLKSLSKFVLRALIAGVGHIINDFAHTLRRVQAHYTIVYVTRAAFYFNEAVLYQQLAQGQTGGLRREKLYWKSVMSVALITLKYQREKALEFWRVVAHNGASIAGDPRQVLREFLIGQEKFGGVSLYTHRAAAHIVAWCWSKYFNGELAPSIDIEAAVTAEPINIAGTPFHFGRAELVRGRHLSDACQRRRAKASLGSFAQFKRAQAAAQRGKTIVRDASGKRVDVRTGGGRTHAGRKQTEPRKPTNGHKKGKKISEATRKAIIKDLKSGKFTGPQIAKRHGVQKSTVYRIRKTIKH